MKRALSPALLAAVLWLGCSGQEKDPAGPTPATFDEVFALQRTTVLEGSAEEPLFDMGHFAVSEDHFVIPDPQNHRVLRFRHDGTFVDAWGRNGQGPGEFTEPDWVGLDRQGRIFVRENTPNFRVQFFDAAGQYLDTFPLYTFGPLTQSFLVEEAGAVRFVTVTHVYCDEERREQGFCTVQEQDLEGEVLRRYAPEREIQPDFKGLPFIAGRDASGRMYLAHRTGNRVAVYDAAGRLERVIDLKPSPDVVPLDMAALPRDPVKSARQSDKMKYTLVRNIYPVGDYVVIDFWRANFPGDGPRVVINVFDREGRLLYHGIEHERGITQGAGERFYIVTQDEAYDFGRYEIREYTLRRKGP
ncbi:hypothetical protein GQ464_007500 [Rhodocaloribacter litoris]|uniref:6-bladed beta-propeller n=1 Tax=Rhodocaloribacter litoris TaxID=2558931 RepID=UPI001E5B1707|nr:6-bladed beta-propeller [Rhodocaloribacter litoris]QXD16773.1 hypothetical protein GQ464_007500 [Rhodocaloribacter litoris]